MRQAFSLLIRLLATTALALSAQAAIAQPVPDERDAQIAALQARVARLEALVAVLAAPRAGEVEPAATAAVDSADALPPPADPPAAAADAPASSRVPQELLPALGRIGAAATFIAGRHSGPFALAPGPFVGGSIDLPLVRVPGGRLLYEFSGGLGLSDSSLRVTSNVAQVANLAVLANVSPGNAANVEAALAGRPPAPYAVSYDVDSQLQLLQVSPFALKYVNTALDRFGVRPYAVAGLGLFVTITNQRVRDTGAATPFAGALIGGQLAAAPELVERGVPSGQGGIDLGISTGGGLEWRLRRGLSLGLDLRRHHLSDARGFTTAALRAGFHF